jgi:pimeloyl-ACP methyl ester carboxylesterase
MEPRASRVPAADGVSLALHEWSTHGVPLLLLHGFGNSARVWDELADALAPYYRVLALDLRGHGDSDRDPEGRYDHLAMARDVEAVCERLGLERLVLVGHSMGGRVALRFAGRNAAKLAGLVIVDSAPELDVRGTSRIRQETETREPVFATLREYENVLAENYPATRPATLARLARHWARQRADGRYELKLDPAFFRRRAGDGDVEAWMRAEAEALWDGLRKASCPTLVVRGAASDVLSAEVADRMVDDVLADGRLVVVPAAGHSVMTDNPDAFRDAVCAFALGEA